MATIPEEWSIPRLIDFTEKGKATGSESDTVVDTKIDKRDPSTEVADDLDGNDKLSKGLTVRKLQPRSPPLEMESMDSISESPTFPRCDSPPRNLLRDEDMEYISPSKTNEASPSPRRYKQDECTNQDDMLSQYTSRTLTKLEEGFETCVKKITFLGSQLEEAKSDYKKLAAQCDELSRRLDEFMVEDNYTTATEISQPAAEQHLLQGISKDTLLTRANQRLVELEKSLKAAADFEEIEKRTISLLKAVLVLREVRDDKREVDRIEDKDEDDDTGDMEQKSGSCVLQ